MKLIFTREKIHGFLWRKKEFLIYAYNTEKINLKD